MTEKATISNVWRWTEGRAFWFNNPLTSFLYRVRDGSNEEYLQCIPPTKWHSKIFQRCACRFKNET